MTQDALIQAPAGLRISRPRARKDPRQPNPLGHLASKTSRGVRAVWCRACGAPILVGLDADMCALDARVDPTPLDAMGEMLALLSTPPRRTYTLDALGHTAQLTRRKAWAMRQRPAGPRLQLLTWDVVPEHRCHQPLPAIPTNLPERLMTKETNVCPF